MMSRGTIEVPVQQLMLRQTDGSGFAVTVPEFAVSWRLTAVHNHVSSADETIGKKNGNLFFCITSGTAGPSNKYRACYHQHRTQTFEQQSLAPTFAKPLTTKNEAE